MNSRSDRQREEEEEEEGVLAAPYSPWGDNKWVTVYVMVFPFHDRC